MGQAEAEQELTPLRHNQIGQTISGWLKLIPCIYNNLYNAEMLLHTPGPPRSKSQACLGRRPVGRPPDGGRLQRDSRLLFLAPVESLFALGRLLCPTGTLAASDRRRP